MIERNGYAGFAAFPASPGTTGPIRPIDGLSQSIRVILTGAAFSVRVQISNAEAKNGPPHSFTPPDSSFETFITAVPADSPLSIPGPVRFVRLIVDSGQVEDARIEESTVDAWSIQLENTAVNAGNSVTAINDATSGLLALTLAQQVALQESRDAVTNLNGVRVLAVTPESVTLASTTAGNPTPSSFTTPGGNVIGTVKIDTEALGQVSVIRVEELAGALDSVQAALVDLGVTPINTETDLTGKVAGVYAVRTTGERLTWSGSVVTGRVQAGPTLAQVQAAQTTANAAQASVAPLVTNTAQSVSYPPNAAMQQILSATEGHAPADYLMGLGSTIQVLNATTTQPGEDIRRWGVTGAISEEWDSKNAADSVALNGRTVTTKQGGYAGAGLFLAEFKRTQINGIAQLTNGSTAVTAVGGSNAAWQTELNNPSLGPSAVFFCGNSGSRVPVPAGQPVNGTTSDGLPGQAVTIASIGGAAALTLSQPWSGPSGNYLVFRTVQPGQSAPETGMFAVEFDANNYSGFDANTAYDRNAHLLWLVSGGDSRMNTAISILVPPAGYANNAPFVTGINFFRDSIYQHGIQFDDCQPRTAAIYFTDNYAGNVAISLKEGLTKGIQFRLAAFGAAYLSGNGDRLEINGGVGGVAFADNARTRALAVMEDGGNFTFQLPDKGVAFTRPGATPTRDLLRTAGDGRLVVNDLTAGTDRFIGFQAAALTVPVPAPATGAAPTKAEHDKVVARLAELESVMRAAGLLT